MMLYLIRHWSAEGTIYLWWIPKCGPEPQVGGGPLRSSYPNRSPGIQGGWISPLRLPRLAPGKSGPNIIDSELATEVVTVSQHHKGIYTPGPAFRALFLY